MGHVHRDQAIVTSEAVESCQRALAVQLWRFGDFVRGFVHMAMHRHSSWSASMRMRSKFALRTVYGACGAKRWRPMGRCALVVHFAGAVEIFVR